MPARTVRRIFALYGSNDMDHSGKMCPIEGREQAFSSQTRIILKLTYLQNYNYISNQILHSDKDHQVLFVGGPTRITNSRWRTAAILKKIENLGRGNSSDFDEIWNIDAVRFSWPLRTVVKHLKFKNSKMAAAAILKNPKVEIFRQRFKRSPQNLAWWRSSTLLTLGKNL